MTESWTSGYVTEVDYQWGYFSELNPLRAKMALLCNGIACPEPANACELGFGQGLSLNLHAAADTIAWHGIDFNPSHATIAREMAELAGGGARVSDQSFAEFRARRDLPEFDFIGVHGVWSWISEENRRDIAGFVREKLKVGGVLYISYNVEPGWSGFLPLRNLLVEYLDRVSPSGRGMPTRIDEALEFAKKMMAAEPAYAKHYPSAVKRLEQAAKQNRNYLAHEFFNRDWQPMSFLDVNRWLSEAKMTFACSANFLDQVPVLTATQAQRDFMGEVPDPLLRQQLTDFMNCPFLRRDYWVKGVRRLSANEQMERFNELHVVLTRAAEDASLTVQAPIGEANLQEETSRPLLDELSGNRVKSIGDLIRKLQSEQRTVVSLLHSLLVLMGGNQISPANDNPSARIKRQCERLNRFIKNRSRDFDDIHSLASPVTGGGIPVSRIHQLFLLGVEEKAATGAELARVAWRHLEARNQRLLKDGKPLETDAENLAELESRAEDFLTKARPVYSALGVQ